MTDPTQPARDPKPAIVRCVSCDGFGWFEQGTQTTECDWCGGIGYVYRQPSGLDQRIPSHDYERIADQLETLEQQRLRELGYQGQARQPWQQAVRKGTSGGENPYASDDDTHDRAPDTHNTHDNDTT